MYSCLSVPVLVKLFQVGLCNNIVLATPAGMEKNRPGTFLSAYSLLFNAAI